MGICNSSLGKENKNKDISAKWQVEYGQEQQEQQAQQRNGRGYTDDQDEPATDPRQVEAGFDHLPLDLALNTIACVLPTNADANATATATATPNVVQFWTGWEDGTIKRLDVASKAHQPKANHPDKNNNSLRHFTRNVQVHTRGVNRILASKLYPDTLFTCSRDTTICRLTNLDQNQTSGVSADPVPVTPSLTLRGHSLNVSTIAIDDQETTLCSGARDTQTILWDLSTGQIKSKNSLSQNVVTCSKWLPNNERLIAQGSEDLHVRIWDERTSLRTPSQVFDGYVYFPLSLDVSHDGKYLLTSSKGFNGVGAEVRIWDRRMNRQLRMLEGHQQDASCCLFLPFSSTGLSATGIPIPVSASKDGFIKIWNMSNPAKSSFKPLLCELHEPTSDLFTSLCVFPMPGNPKAGSDDDDTSVQTIDFELLGGTFHGQLHHMHFQYQIQTNSIFIL